MSDHDDDAPPPWQIRGCVTCGAPCADKAIVVALAQRRDDGLIGLEARAHLFCSPGCLASWAHGFALVGVPPDGAERPT